jgi:hypothetical protein
MPLTELHSTPVGSGFDEPNRSGVGEPASQTQVMKQETTSAEISQSYGGRGVQEDEEGMVSLDKVGLDEPNDPLHYPVAHRAIVLVIQSMNGSSRTQVLVDDVRRTLCHRKYAASDQGALGMIAEARGARVIRAIGKHVVLEDPGFSRDGFPSAI